MGEEDAHKEDEEKNVHNHFLYGDRIKVRPALKFRPFLIF